MEKISVLQIVPTLQSGGVETGVVDFANFLCAEGHKSFVLTSGGKMMEQLSSGVSVAKLNVETKNFFKILLNAFKIKKIANQLQVDIIHVRSRAPAWSCFFAKLLGMQGKLVTTFHGFYSHKGFLKRLYNSSMLKGEIVVAVSSYIAGHIKKVYKLPESKIAVVHRGINLEPFKSFNFSAAVQSLEERDRQSMKKILSEERKVILLPARFSLTKGHAEAIRAVYEIKNRNFICVMVGKQRESDSYIKSLRNLIRTLGLEGVFEFLPETKQLKTLYYKSFIVLCPSCRPEPFGRVVAEAGLMKKPVIAANIAGPAEIIEHNKTGWLVDTSNAKEFSRAISFALECSPEKIAEIGQNAHDRITKNFSLDKMCQGYLKVYQDALGL